MKEIARRLIGGAWRTGLVDENGNGGSPIVKDLDSAAILGLHNARTELVAGQAGKIIVVTSWAVFFVDGGTPYTGGSDIMVATEAQIDGEGNPWFYAKKTTFTAGSDQVGFGHEEVLDNCPLSEVDGQALVVGTYSGGAFLGGNGTARVVAEYTIIDTPS